MTMHSFACALLVFGVVAAVPVDDEARFALPDDLLIGAGVAAVQSEGAWNEGGKSESMVDFTMHSGKLQQIGFRDPHLHDVAADSYHRYREDVQAAVQLKLQLYRISISWSRVLPDANASNPNKEGVDYYHNYIDEILKYNMTPMVTMYHFDHPQSLEDEFNGWMDRRMVDKFGEYAAFILNEYGAKVKLWTTLNEPNVYCTYWNTMIALARGGPADSVSRMNLYPCMHHFVLAHGVAYKAFVEGKHEGQIGFTVMTLLSRPSSTSPEDVFASEAYNDMSSGMLLHPLVYGDYPQIVKDIAGDALPTFTEDEVAMIKNSTHYVGLNVYYGMTVEYQQPTLPRRPNVADFYKVGYRSPTGKTLDVYPMGMVAPDAMRSALLWAWFNYKLPILITENGVGDPNMPVMHDHLRAEYHSAFLRAMASTIHDFGVKVIGYCAWSLIDCFEWSSGYNRPFGLVHVDYKNGTLKRTLKDSASFWLELADRRVVPLVQSSSTVLHMGPVLFIVTATACLFNAV